MASSLTLALRTAQSGLITNQTALDTVANNVANVNTVGYSRKIIQTERRVVDGEGAGIQLSEITRSVDEGLLRSLRLELSDLRALEIQGSFFERLQDLFGAPADNGSLAHTMQDLINAVELLAVSPDKALEQSELVRQGQDITFQLQDMTSAIQELRLQADQQIEDIVEEINTLAARISDFNDTIVRNGATNRDTTDLKDQRDLAITRLAELVDIRTFQRSDGDIVIFTSSGRTLVDNLPATVTHSGAASSSPLTNEANGGFGGIFVGAQIEGNDITDELRSGELKGLVELRDDILVNLQSQLDELATELRDTFNSLHNQGTTFPGLQTMSGTRTFIDGATQTIRLENNADVRIALFDRSGVQQAQTTLTTIMASGDYGTIAEDAGGDWTINEVAATIQDWLRENGASQASVALNANGRLDIALNQPSLNLAFRDELNSNGTIPAPLDSTASPATVSFNADGAATGVSIGGQSADAGDTFSVTVDGTTVTYTASAGDSPATIATNLTNAINANGTVSAVVTASVLNSTSIRLVPVSSGSTFTLTASKSEASGGSNNTTYGLANIDEQVSGFSNFFGLNDFFVDNLSTNVQESDVVSSNFSASASTISFRDDITGSLGSVTVSAGDSLQTIATAITNNISNVTASVVTDGVGVRLRISHDNGDELVVTQALGNTILTDIGMHRANTRVASQMTVRSDIIDQPSLIAAGRMQFDATLGAAGQYTTTIGEGTTIRAIAAAFTGNIQFESAGGIGNINTRMDEYAAEILARNANLASRNEVDTKDQKTLTDALQLKSDSVSGVNLDEEMSNLILFEQAYSAAARIITIIQDMFDALESAVS